MRKARPSLARTQAERYDATNEGITVREAKPMTPRATVGRQASTKAIRGPRCAKRNLGHVGQSGETRRRRRGHREERGEPTTDECAKRNPRESKARTPGRGGEHVRGGVREAKPNHTERGDESGERRGATRREETTRCAKRNPRTRRGEATDEGGGERADGRCAKRNQTPGQTPRRKRTGPAVARETHGARSETCDPNARRWGVRKQARTTRCARRNPRSTREREQTPKEEGERGRAGQNRGKDGGGGGRKESREGRTSARTTLERSAECGSGRTRQRDDARKCSPIHDETRLRKAQRERKRARGGREGRPRLDAQSEGERRDETTEGDEEGPREPEDGEVADGAEVSGRGEPTEGEEELELKGTKGGPGARGTEGQVEGTCEVEGDVLRDHEEAGGEAQAQREGGGGGGSTDRCVRRRGARGARCCGGGGGAGGTVTKSRRSQTGSSPEWSTRVAKETPTRTREEKEEAGATQRHAQGGGPIPAARGTTKSERQFWRKRGTMRQGRGREREAKNGRDDDVRRRSISCDIRKVYAGERSAKFGDEPTIEWDGGDTTIWRERDTPEEGERKVLPSSFSVIRDKLGL